MNLLDAVALGQGKIADRDAEIAELEAELAQANVYKEVLAATVADVDTEITRLRARLAKLKATVAAPPPVVEVKKPFVKIQWK